MLRLQTETGWWLITHPDHAHLAGAFARHWGNDLFAPPLPRTSVLHGIDVHDDGWAARDAQPAVTREGKPAAFSSELVGKYSAFEEIDLADYLAVRERAVEDVEQRDAYAALLVSMHTYNLLTERADRSTIAAEQLPLLDAFLERQRRRQEKLRNVVRSERRFETVNVSDEGIGDNFRLLQATDNLSLLSCVAFMQPATLLHPLRLRDGGLREVVVEAVAARHFRLTPYPFDEGLLRFEFPARHVKGRSFASAEELRKRLAKASVEQLEVVVSG
jgi:hypothetical protein